MLELRMKEYQVVYLIEGKGYTKDLPWIDVVTDDFGDAQTALKDLKDYHELCSYGSEEWIEEREVTEWRRCD